ncbi:MAG: type II CRISPR-associated endonuclease Cas1 [Thermoguttaceae bacterium]|nr:type II CRISPR-associated endonuclease Cas1 [Thermoguttaceae bacterium]
MNSTRWRSIVIGENSQLSCTEGQMIVRTSEKKEVLIPLYDVQTIIVTSTRTSLSACLLCELQNQNIRIVFCDENHLPYGELIPYSAHGSSAGMLREQIKWRKNVRQIIWKEIISLKIQMQRNLLLRLGIDFQDDKFQKYLKAIKEGDWSNREAASARLYFSTLFGSHFCRKAPSNINHVLNYGYAVLASAATRSIVTHGFNPQIGIHHNSITNPLNLTYDLIEPFRPLVDQIAFENREQEMDREVRNKLIDLTNKEIRYCLTPATVLSAIDRFVVTMTNAMKSGEIPQIEMDFES